MARVVDVDKVQGALDKAAQNAVRGSPELRAGRWWPSLGSKQILQMTDSVDKAVENIIKNLPIKQIYDDGLSAPTKQVGQALTDIAKTVRLALFPFQVLAAVQDRAEKFIERAVRRVPNERRVPPAPQLLGPVLEGIRYEPEGTPLDEMFSQLLSRSVDRERVAEAHPAYPILIKQLSSDEAKILALLHGVQFNYVYTREYDAKTNLFVGPNVVEVDELPREGLTFPANVGFYFDHLSQLGLAGIYQQGNQEPLFNPDKSKQIGTRARCKYTLTDLGQRFVLACMEKKIEPSR